MTRTPLSSALFIGAFYAVSLYSSFGCGPLLDRPVVTPPPVRDPGNSPSLVIKVKDADTNAPIEGADVVIEQGKRSWHVRTGFAGSFTTLPGDLRPGDVDITVSMPGYRTRTVGVTVRNEYHVGVEVLLRR